MKKIGNNTLEVKNLKRRRKMNKKKKVFITFIVLLLVWISGFFMYHTYQNIEIDNNSYIATKAQSTTEEQTVETVQEKSKTIADVLEETTEKVVGISKLKNEGNSILSKSSEN